MAYIKETDGEDPNFDSKENPYLLKVKKATLTKNSESNTLCENNIVSQANCIGSSLRDILNFRKLHYNTNEMNQTIQRKINSLRAIGCVFELKRQKECKENLKINENSFKNPQYTKIRHVYYKVNRKASFNSSCTNFNQERKAKNTTIFGKKL